MPNSEKSSVIFSGKLCSKLKHIIKAELGFKEMKEGAIYLGNTLIFGKSKIKEFNRLKDLKIYPFNVSCFVQLFFSNRHGCGYKPFMSLKVKCKLGHSYSCLSVGELFYC